MPLDSFSYDNKVPNALETNQVLEHDAANSQEGFEDTQTEDEFSIDTVASIEQLYDDTVQQAVDRLTAAGIAPEQFTQTETFNNVLAFAALLERTKQKIDLGEAVTELDGELIQIAYDQVEDSPVDAIPEETEAESFEGTGFDFDRPESTMRRTLTPASLDPVDDTIKISYEAKTPELVIPEQTATAPATKTEQPSKPKIQHPKLQPTPQVVTNQFAPASIKDKRSPRWQKEPISETQLAITQAVKQIENLGDSSWISRFVNEGQSPYQQLAEANFEELVFQSVVPYATLEQRADFMRDLRENQQVDQAAFDAWMNYLPQIEALGIETAGKTFKEVIDGFLRTQLTTGNAQPT